MFYHNDTTARLMRPRTMFNEQRTTFFANFKVAKMSKLGRQGVQDAQVEQTIDIRGFGSSCPRCPSCFEGPYGASIQESFSLINDH